MENNTESHLPTILMLIIFFLIAFLFSIFLLVCRWKIFVKAGKKGWESLIPIYNIIVFLDIVKKPTWWILLLLIPLYNIYIAIVLNIRLAKFFGKDEIFGIMLTLFNFIFEPILAFGKDKYQEDALADERDSKSWV